MVERKIDCFTCREALHASCGDKGDHLQLIRFKDRGGLVYPSEAVFKVCDVTEGVIAAAIKLNDGKLNRALNAIYQSVFLSISVCG